MGKPTVEWNEDDLLSLPRDENDTFERKGSQLLDLTLPNVQEGNVLDELAKQLSAFANMGGGRIVYGISDAGTADSGGVARPVKGRRSTKEWLEDVIPNLTDFEIAGVNVYEIPPKATGSALGADKALYIVDVPDSERAPHQSKRDLKYYVRLGGKSQPASHRLVEDIRDRARHPNLEVRDLQITNAVASASRVARLLESEFELILVLRFGVNNSGRVRAANACLQLSATVPLSTNMAETTEYFPRSATQGTVLLELKNPLYPLMGVVVECQIKTSAEFKLLPKGTLTLSGRSPEDVTLCITTFADSAPARRQEFKLSDIDSERCLMKVIQQVANRIHSSGQR
jgi:hypothetical protein